MEISKIRVHSFKVRSGKFKEDVHGKILFLNTEWCMPKVKVEADTIVIVMFKRFLHGHMDMKGMNG